MSNVSGTIACPCTYTGTISAMSPGELGQKLPRRPWGDLTAINVDPASTVFSSQDCVLYNKAKTTLILYPARKTGSAFTIPAGVTSIGDGAFSNCDLTSVTIPDSVTSIGDRAFSDHRLTAINVNPANTVFSSQDGVLYNKDKTTLILYPAGKTGTFTIPAGVTSIKEEAFWSCQSLTSVTIPAGVTSIGYGAFSGCYSLTSVTFQGTIPSSGFGTSWVFGGIGDLRDKFYATDTTNGTPGTYTRANDGSTWTKQP